MREIAQQADQIALEAEERLPAERLSIVHLVQLCDHPKWILARRLLLSDAVAVLERFWRK